MAALRNIVIFVLVVSFLTFVAFFGRLPALRNTPIGALHRILWIHIPNAFSRLDTALTGGRTISSLSRTGDYLMHDKHPFVTIIFLGLITSCAVLILPQVWSASSSTQQFLVLLLLPQPYVFTFLAASVRLNPQLFVTASNIDDQLTKYPYDYCLYHPDSECRTCKLPKPARSKHCSICKSCISRADHHCIWVNNCLGRGNYRYFLLLLISTSLLLFLGTHLALTFLHPRVLPFLRQPWTQSSRTAGDPSYVWLIAPAMKGIDYSLRWLQVALSIGGLSVTGVGMLATFTAPLPLGLLAYHVYLIWAGTTTNESGKWTDWKEDMMDGIAWMGDMSPDSADGGDSECDWPTRSKYCMVTTTDGQAPRSPLPRAIEGRVAVDSWRRVWRLAQVENIYDLGFWDNLGEALK